MVPEKNETGVSFEHIGGPVLSDSLCQQYKRLFIKNFVVSVNSVSKGDSYCFVHGNLVVEIHNILQYPTKEKFAIGKKFESYHIIVFTVTPWNLNI